MIYLEWGVARFVVGDLFGTGVVARFVVGDLFENVVLGSFCSRCII